MNLPPSELPSEAKWLRKGLLGKFTREAESAFRNFYNLELINRARHAAIAAAIVMFLYSVWDAIALPNHLIPSFLWVRSVFVTIPMLLTWWLTYQVKAYKHFQFWTALASIAGANAIVALVAIARVKGHPIEYEGVILMVIFIYCCGGISRTSSTIAGISVAIVYPIAETLSGLHPDQVFVRTVFILSTNIVGFVSVSLMEQSARRNFRLTVEINNQANRDDLTGMFNRRAFRVNLDTMWASTIENNQFLAIAMIDIDHFKLFNDYYGHSDGDVVLRKVSDVIKSHTSMENSTSARFGGEEFVCVWSGYEAERLSQDIDKLVKNITELQIPHAQSPTSMVSISIGAYHFKPTPNHNIKESINKADKLLYEAKHSGRNRSKFHSDI